MEYKLTKRDIYTYKTQVGRFEKVRAILTLNKLANQRERESDLKYDVTCNCCLSNRYKVKVQKSSPTPSQTPHPH